MLFSAMGSDSLLATMGSNVLSSAMGSDDWMCSCGWDGIGEVSKGRAGSCAVFGLVRVWVLTSFMRS